VNRLVHLSGWGDFQIKQIDEVAEHCPWSLHREKANEDSSMEKRAVGCCELLFPILSHLSLLARDRTARSHCTCV